MRLIINIPEEVYKNIQSKSTEIQAEGYTLENAVLNGIPLEQIKTEIRKKITFNSFNEGIVKYDDILEIIERNKE